MEEDALKEAWHEGAGCDSGEEGVGGRMADFVKVEAEFGEFELGGLRGLG